MKTDEVKKYFKKYKRIFKIQTDVEFKFKTPQFASTYSVSYSVRGDKKAIVSGLPEHLMKDMEEITAMIKLGEIHPLLCTFYFQKDISTNETAAKFCGMFFELCQPLQDAWVWKIVKQYLPKNIFENKIKELVNLYKSLTKKDSTLPFLSKYAQRRIILGTYLVLYSLGFNPILDLQFSSKEEKEEVKLWEKYINSLKEFSTKDPDPTLFVRLPEIVLAPYRVMIQKFPYWHYEVRRLQ